MNFIRQWWENGKRYRRLRERERAIELREEYQRGYRKGLDAGIEIGVRLGRTRPQWGAGPEMQMVPEMGTIIE